MQFDDKSVLITGAASGIGRATALKFGALGAALLIADRDESGLTETGAMILAAGGRTESFVGDMTDGATVVAMVDRAVALHGRIDVFFCNAGIQGALGPIYAFDEQEFDRVLSCNTKSVFLGLRHVLPLMIRQRSGSVVVTCSIAALGGIANLPAYVASKHAALGLVRAAAVDVAPFGVRVNGVCPGAVDTPMLASVLESMKLADQAVAKARFAASSPLGRLVDPAEIADAVVFLCSAQTRTITGSTITIDGGLSAGIGSATKPG